MTKTIIYTRFSPRRNSDTCESIETQLDLCREYAQNNGFEIIQEYEDRALSGSEEDRPGLWQAIDALRKGYVLLVYRLDRLSRSVYLSHIIQEAVNKKGASIVSISGEGTWKDSPEDELIRNILHALAEYERKVIAARTRAAMLRHQKNGRRMSDKTPYGWRRNPDNPALMIEDEAEQQVIKRIVYLRANGMGLREICRRLDAERIPLRNSKKWHHQTVRNILRREGIEIKS